MVFFIKIVIFFHRTVYVAHLPGPYYNCRIEEKSMVKKPACMFALIFAFVWYAHAADLTVGIEGGLTYNTLNASTGYRAFTAYDNGTGFLAGVPVLVSFNEYLAMGSGLRYIQKNYQYRRDFLDRYPMYSDYINNYLQVPVFADISAEIARFRMFLDLGATVGFWLNSNRKGTLRGISDNPYNSNYVQTENFEERIEFNNIRDNRIEAALFTGIGVKYDMNLYTLSISAQYHYGLTNLQKNYMSNNVSQYNNTITVQVGALIKLDTLLGGIR
jgi:hypothetical protein